MGRTSVWTCGRTSVTRTRDTYALRLPRPGHRARSGILSVLPSSRPVDDPRTTHGHNDRPARPRAGAARPPAAQEGRDQLPEQHRDRRRVDRPGLQPGRHDRIRRPDLRHRRPYAGRDHRLLHPDVLHRRGLQRDEQGRPRLRDDVLMDHPVDGGRLGLGDRLDGDLLRHRRQRQPGADRRNLRLHPVRAQQRGRQHGGRDDPRRRVHHPAHLDLLARDRALGAHPAGAAGVRDDDPHHLRRRRADQGVHELAGGLFTYPARLVQPVLAELRLADRGDAARRVSLLGVGHGRIGQRGERELRLRTGQVGPGLDGRADRDLPAGGGRRPGLRRHEVPGQQPQRHLRRRPGAAESSARCTSCSRSRY